jgi:hypothetical protein
MLAEGILFPYISMHSAFRMLQMFLKYIKGSQNKFIFADDVSHQTRTEKKMACFRVIYLVHIVKDIG